MRTLLLPAVWSGLVLLPTVIVPLNVLVNEHRLYLPLAFGAIGNKAGKGGGGKRGNGGGITPKSAAGGNGSAGNTRGGAGGGVGGERWRMRRGGDGRRRVGEFVDEGDARVEREFSENV